MALAFVLDVEGENVIREVFPFGRTLYEGVGVFQDVGNAILEIGDAIWIRIPGCDVVVAGFSIGAVEGWEVVFGNVCVVAPAAELIPIVQRDCELDV